MKRRLSLSQWLVLLAFTALYQCLTLSVSINLSASDDDALTGNIFVPEEAPFTTASRVESARRRRGGGRSMGPNIFRRVFDAGRQWIKDSSRRRSLARRLRSITQATYIMLHKDYSLSDVRSFFRLKRVLGPRRRRLVLKEALEFNKPHWLYLSSTTRRFLVLKGSRTVRLPLTTLYPIEVPVEQTRQELIQAEYDRERLPKSVKAYTLKVLARGVVEFTGKLKAFMVGGITVVNIAEMLEGTVAPIAEIPPEVFTRQDKGYLSFKASDFSLKALNTSVVFPEATKHAFWLTQKATVAFLDTRKAIVGELSAAIGGGSRYAPLAEALTTLLRNLWCKGTPETEPERSDTEPDDQMLAAEEAIAAAAIGNAEKNENETTQTSEGDSTPPTTTRDEDDVTGAGATGFEELMATASSPKDLANGETCADAEVERILQLLSQEDPRDGFQAAYDLFRTR